jgi:hypothetical protein
MAPKNVLAIEPLSENSYVNATQYPAIFFTLTSKFVVTIILKVKRVIPLVCTSNKYRLIAPGWIIKLVGNAKT